MKRKRQKMILITCLCVLLVPAAAAGIGFYALMGGFYHAETYTESHDILTPVLSVSGGLVQGYCDEEYPSVEVYKGIPFAAPPAGELRFKAPQDVIPWDGVLDCTRWSSSAMQAKPVPFLNYTEEYIVTNKVCSEDCLYLNVWTTTEAREKTASLPVIVYIHGGGYSGGGASCEIYEGQAIADKGAVFVSINYRVGVFGYLATTELVQEDVSAGNYGLMDQIKALEWVRANIAAFGGDPQNVTIMGQSAGGQAVQSLLVSPKAKGLFSHAVVMSSNAVTRTGYRLQSERIQDGDKAVKGKTPEELRSMSAEELMKLAFDDYGPCIDGVYLKDTYVNSVVKGECAEADILFTAADNPKTPFWSTQTDSCFYGLYTSDNINSTEDLIAGMYYQVLAREKAGTYKGNIYFQNFEHMMPMTEKYWGTTHSSDIPYMLNIFSDYRKDYWTEKDYALGEQMSGYLVYFARYGKMPEEWQRADEICCYMNFDDSTELKQVTAEQLQEYHDVNVEYQWLSRERQSDE